VARKKEPVCSVKLLVVRLLSILSALAGTITAWTWSALKLQLAFALALLSLTSSVRSIDLVSRSKNWRKRTRRKSKRFASLESRLTNGTI